MGTVQLPEEDENFPQPLLDPLLCATDGQYVLYDFSAPLALAIVPGHPLWELTDSRPATDPPSTRVIVTSSQFRGNISIAVDETNFVSVLDVLNGVHQYLHGRVDGRSITALQRSQAEASFRDRCDLIADPHVRASEVEAGLRRVDLLGEIHCFAGLVGVEGNVLQLRLRG